ncbi:MAG TPA: lysylphosphatidylglycerol synthase domain-containing protein [Solirubrobacterales bacterium]|nr:lysylphosphatidylglycerol synthase domain-containing protein [Solirubrobacterales bacterium]
MLLNTKTRRRRSTAAIRRTVSALVPLGAVAIFGYLILTRGSALLAALAAVPPWVLAAAVGAHVLTLALRTEAWRTVLRAAGGERLEPVAVHAANAGAFLAGTVQGQAAMPARVALLRRFGGEEAPSVAQVALGDASIVMFEVCASAVLAAVGSTTIALIPGWAPWAMLAGAFAILTALRLLYGRFREHKIAAGLGVLARPRLRNRLAVIVAGFTAMAFVRTLIVMIGFGLPTDPAHVCLVLFTMGAVGLLPLGVGTGPASMVAALGGTTSIVTATAAGMVVSAATVLAVLIYAGAVWAWRTALARAAAPQAAPV